METMKTSIKIECLKENINQDILANRIGCSSVHLSRVVTGKTIPSVKIAFKIAKYFNLRIEDFREFNFKL